VNGWFGKMAKLDEKSIDDASQFNKNYRVTKADEIDLKLSPEYRTRLNSEAQFLFESKIVAKRAQVSQYITEVQ
jgi:hypothetical protein